MNLELVSERLALRPIDMDALDALHSLWTDAHVRRFLWDGEIIPLARTREIVERNSAMFEECGFGIWGVRERGADALLGFAGYWHFRTPPVRELLFGVAAEHWNRGIATESSRAVIRYGFEELAFGCIDASTDVPNTASARVMEKLGMVRHRRERIGGLDTLFFRLVREDWSLVTGTPGPAGAPPRRR
jgi:ribosomal-protein-alanine N-acetyltransferase